jgi:antimicrobial peptide system SdpA family protein
MRLRIPRRGPRGRRSMKRTMGVGVAYACLLAAAGIWSLAATLPSNILWERTQLPALRVELNTIAGQNFAFFTRSPEDNQIIAYRLNPDGATTESLMVTPQGKASNLFGLSRTQRAQGPELANLVRVIRLNAWADCTGLDRPTCVERASGRPKVLLHNDSPVPTVCGRVVFTVESTTKWAYRRLAEDRYVIERIAPASVDCIHSH